MAPKNAKAKAKAAAKKEAAKQAFAAAAKRGAASASSSAGTQSKKQKTAEQSPAQGPTKQETQGFLSFLKGAIAGKDQERASQAASVLAKYQELGLDPTKKREMIQEFFKAEVAKARASLAFVSRWPSTRTSLMHGLGKATSMPLSFLSCTWSM